MKMDLEKVSDEDIEKEAKRRGLKEGMMKLKFTIGPDDFNYCEKCGAPVDRHGKYRPD